jgi:hypothetical protein
MRKFKNLTKRKQRKTKSRKTKSRKTKSRRTKKGGGENYEKETSPSMYM